MSTAAKRKAHRPNPPRSTANKENQAISPGNDPAVPAVRRGSRPVVPTAHIATGVVQNMRPGNIRTRSQPSNDQASDADSDDPTAEEQSRDVGDDADDVDYEEPRKRTRRNPEAALQELSVSNGSTRSSAQNSSQNDTADQMSVHNPPSTSSQLSRLAALQGGQLHSRPAASIPPVAAPSLVHPGFQVIPAGSTAVAPSQTPSAFIPGRHVHSPQLNPITIPQSLRYQGPEPSDDNEAHEARDEARRAKKAEHNRKRPRYYQYTHMDCTIGKVMRKTGDLLQVQASTAKPYPSPSDQETAVEEKFKLASRICGAGGDFYVLTNADEKLLRQEFSNIRSRVKAEAVDRVAYRYKLVEVPNKSQRQKNIKQVAFLLEVRFYYEVPETKQGRFQHEIIKDIVHAVWFNHSGALGCLFQDAFDPIPLPALALVVTAVYHVLKSWETGEYKDKKFKASKYNIYDDFLAELAEFDKGEMQDIWYQWRRRMFNKGLRKAGIVQEKDTVPIIETISDEDVQAEMLRLQSRLAESDDSDSEDIPQPGSGDGPLAPEQ